MQQNQNFLLLLINVQNGMYKITWKGNKTEVKAMIKERINYLSSSIPDTKGKEAQTQIDDTVYVRITDRSKAVVPVLVLLFVALWFILRGDLLYVFPCVILFLCFSVLLVLRLPRLGKRELILVLFVRLFGLCLFGFVRFLFLLRSGKGCGLWLWHSLDFFFFYNISHFVVDIAARNDTKVRNVIIFTSFWYTWNYM